MSACVPISIVASPGKRQSGSLATMAEAREKNESLGLRLRRSSGTPWAAQSKNESTKVSPAVLGAVAVSDAVWLSHAAMVGTLSSCTSASISTPPSMHSSSSSSSAPECECESDSSRSSVASSERRKRSRWLSGPRWNLSMTDTSTLLASVWSSRSSNRSSGASSVTEWLLDGTVLRSDSSRPSSMSSIETADSHGDHAEHAFSGAGCSLLWALSASEKGTAASWLAWYVKGSPAPPRPTRRTREFFTRRRRALPVPVLSPTTARICFSVTNPVCSARRARILFSMRCMRMSDAGSTMPCSRTSDALRTTRYRNGSLEPPRPMRCTTCTAMSLRRISRV
mmetsp:Transcript_14672/g.29423  ORF Transcript_14672/g.29423 Transcript_14672/m.29423 type:complete len:339 (+) Transcript_14672:1060-2076(+)